MSNFDPAQYKVLIVDDVARNIQVLGSILRESGFALSFAMDGKSAFDLISKEHYDLILLDIMMPQMDGYEVCAKLKQNPETINTPVIFLTAKTSVESIVKGFKTGAVDYITKPFHAEELLARVRTHLELQHTRKKLIQANDTKDMFMSIIAHDLKNPFHAILGFSELLLENFETMDQDKVIKYIQNIHKSSTNLYKLLENLLQWARLQSGKITCNPKKTYLLPIIDKCYATLHSNYKIKKINIITNIDSDVQVFADPDMVELIIRNLLSNALKFSIEQGEIRINCKTLKNFIEISISDDGTGIEEEDLHKIFRIDIKHSRPGTYDEKGTGLGLILCKEFIKQNRGKIWVESKINIGSIFKFTLPLHS